MKKSYKTIVLVLTCLFLIAAFGCGDSSSGSGDNASAVSGSAV